MKIIIQDVSGPTAVRIERIATERGCLVDTQDDDGKDVLVIDGPAGLIVSALYEAVLK